MGLRLATIEQELAAIRAGLAEIADLSRQIRQVVGPFAVPVSNDDLLVQTLFGVKFITPMRDLLMTPQLVVYRQWEAQLSRLLPLLSPPGSVFVDVGANFGYFTCLVANAMGATPGSRVIAVEPNPQMLRLLAVNVQINWSMAPVRVVAAALSDSPGLGTLIVPAERAANATLVAAADNGAPSAAADNGAPSAAADNGAPSAAADNGAPPPDPSATAAAVTVDVLTLDDVLRDEARVDVLKIDVEGLEAAVLRGASGTLRRPGLRIVLEWAPAQALAAGYAPASLLSLLRAHGFRIFDAETYLDAPAELGDEAIMARPYGNLLALTA